MARAEDQAARRSQEGAATVLGLRGAAAARDAAPGRRLPSAALLAGVGLLATAALIGGAAALRSSGTVAALEGHAPASAAAGGSASAGAPAASSAAAKPEAPARVAAVELDAAKTKGLAALASLAQRYPTDPAVLEALLLAHARDPGGHGAALNVAKKLFEIAPEKAGDDEIRLVILRAASGPPDVASTAFDLMARRMGSAGPDLLYELLIAKNIGKLLQDRAGKLLLDPEVRKLATPALLVADDLRRVTTCPGKPLIERARDQGDRRALQYFKAVLTPTQCGFLGLSQCARCTQAHPEIRAASDAIEKRVASR